MNNIWRKLDNTAKIFSVDEFKNNNTFRLSAVLKTKINPQILKKAIIKTLKVYPSYKVRRKSGLFWDYLETNPKEPIIEKENELPCKTINYRKNNEYLFKITYFNKKINLEIFHALTDGIGGTILLKELLYNYLNIKYKLNYHHNDIIKIKNTNQDENLKNVNKKITYKEKNKKAYLIKEKSNLLKNKTYHYILNLNKTKTICKNNKVSISEYLTAIYIYAIYKTIYNKKSKKDIVVTIPIDLRSQYNIDSFSNFFTFMNVNSNVINKKKITFKTILNQVHKEFKTKLTKENIKSYLSRDVKLGTNLAIRLTPLTIKKNFMKYFGKTVNQKTTTTLSNIGPIKIEEKYQKYIENIMILVSTGNIQKVKCTICSYQNNLTVTINSNLISNKLEKEFYHLLIKHLGKVKLNSNI